MRTAFVLSACTVSACSLMAIVTGQASHASPSASAGGAAPSPANAGPADKPSQPDAEPPFPAITPMLMFSGTAEEAEVRTT